MLTQEYLKECLDYCPHTGLFAWKKRPKQHFERMPDWQGWNNRYPGKLAGAVQDMKACRTNYILICISDKLHKAHRLAWLYMHGTYPDNNIDHINGDGTDNRIVNLRDVTNAENHRNQRRPINNSSGTIGVCWHSYRKAWSSRINLNGKRVNLGYFDDINEAIATRKTAEVEYGYHPNHGRSD